jgi:hypothetical protein
MKRLAYLTYACAVIVFTVIALGGESKNVGWR